MDRLNELLVLALVGRARVRTQGSFAAGELSEPEPDFCVLPLGDYDAEHPQVAHLIIEVSDSSLSYDRGPKALLYAESARPTLFANVLSLLVDGVQPGDDGISIWASTASPKLAVLAEYDGLSTFEMNDDAAAIATTIVVLGWLSGG